MAEVREPRDYAGHNLSSVRARVRAHDFRPTGDVVKHLAKKTWDESDIEDCFAAMTSADFYTSLPHIWRPDDWCDVYKPWYRGLRMYIKFTKCDNGHTIYIQTFCEDHEVHH